MFLGSMLGFGVGCVFFSPCLDVWFCRAFLFGCGFFWVSIFCRAALIYFGVSRAKFDLLFLLTVLAGTKGHMACDGPVPALRARVQEFHLLPQHVQRSSATLDSTFTCP